MNCIFQSLLLIALGIATPAMAAVAVVVNQTGVEARFSVTREGVVAREYVLEVGERTQVSPEGNAKVVVGTGGEARTFPLAAGTVYALEKTGKGLIELRAVGEHRPQRGAKTPKAEGRPPALPSIGAADGDGKPIEAQRPLIIPVKILVDEEEMAKDSVWQKRLTDRVNAASDILERQANARFRVVETGTWRSSNLTTEFVESLYEFERLVEPGAARLAIGFTSQYQLVLGRTHLGGTRGPLANHILIREWSRRINEPERLEVLLHELGHHLGATHSADGESVMRPVLGDRKSRLAKFEIRFDDINARIMRIVGDELREKRFRRLADVSPQAKVRLRAGYEELVKALPNDPATKRMIQLVEAAPSRRPK
jgi:hypothetical protein